MTTRYVFDTEALIAFLYDEPGRSVVQTYLETVESGNTEGLLAETNASEVFYLVARFEGVDEESTPDSVRAADRDIRTLERRGLRLERADWRLAAEIKADGHISLADAHAVALAHETDAVLVAGADDDFDTLPVDVSVERFRSESA